MSKRIINNNDFQQSKHNSQRILIGAGSDKLPNAAFFVGAIIGTAVVLKDGDGNTMITTDTITLDHFPIRCENGVEISGGTILYCVIPYGN